MKNENSIPHRGFYDERMRKFYERGKASLTICSLSAQLNAHVFH